MQPRDGAELEDDAAADVPKRRRVLLFASVALVVLTLDVVSKVLVVAKLPSTHTPVRILGGAVYLDQTRNSGAAFSLGTGFTAILTVVAIAVVVIIVRSASRLRSTGWAVALGLVLGGAIGNLVDRLARDPGIGRGHVVDWVSVFGPNGERWPIFNIADSGIVCGAILAALLAVLGVEFDGRRRVDSDA
ncbi:signal peptidase II [uncultured Jatrophihabitans sp.]|uniref:signal peptidase II n=1 Tax=uncultured Jatrophihabitans sp. TaxID=1610747 RepID=UPI0035CB0C93